MQIIKKTKRKYSARNIRSVHKKYSQATATIWLLYDRSNRIEQKRFTPRWTKITASQFSKGYAIWSMIDVSQPWPWKAESKLAALNRVGQGLGVHCIQGDFKSGEYEVFWRQNRVIDGYLVYLFFAFSEFWYFAWIEGEILGTICIPVLPWPTLTEIASYKYPSYHCKIGLEIICWMNGWLAKPILSFMITIFLKMLS